MATTHPDLAARMRGWELAQERDLRHTAEVASARNAWLKARFAPDSPRRWREYREAAWPCPVSDFADLALSD